MNNHFKPFFLTLTVLLTPSLAMAAPVKSMSLEVFKDGAERSWEVSVNCESIDKPRLMSRPIDQDKWCSNDVKNLCDKNKFSLSRQLCDDNFGQQVAISKNAEPTDQVKIDEVAVEVEKSPAKIVRSANKAIDTSTRVASREDLLKEQMQIEEQRILIQQKQIELRRRELSLQKRQLNAS